jgi:hypothetical protein
MIYYYIKEVLMLIVAILLIVIGVIVGLLGAKLFRVLLPIIGLVSGSMVGFIGVQAVFGTGVVATTIAVAVAVILGLLLAILSFAFFDLAIIVYAAVLGAGALSYLGIALGLNENGFLVFMLALSGAIMTAIWAAKYSASTALVVVFSSLVGSAYVLAGFLLVVGNITLEGLNETGVNGVILDVVDQSFLWFIVWVGLGLVAAQVQYRSITADLFTNTLQYDEKNRSVL